MDLGLGAREKIKIKANVSPERQEAIIGKFAKRRKTQYYLLAIGLLAIALAIIAKAFPGFNAGPVTQGGFIFIFLGVAVLVMVFTRFNWRCPECSVYLGSMIAPETCPRCGVKLKTGGSKSRG